MERKFQTSSDDDLCCCFLRAFILSITKFSVRVEAKISYTGVGCSFPHGVYYKAETVSLAFCISNNIGSSSRRAILCVDAADGTTDKK